MKVLHISHRVWLALLLAACALPCPAVEKPAPQPKDSAEAEQWLQKELEAEHCKGVQFQLDAGTVTCTLASGPAKIDLYRVTSVGPMVRDPSGEWAVSYSIQGDTKEYKALCTYFARERLERYREALIYLARLAGQNVVRNYQARLDAALEKFKPMAEAWRNLAVKPKMPDDAYAHMVLAENALKDKDLKKTANEYELALRAFPTWPDGQSNAALIEAQLGDYWMAIHRLKEYLLLVPDAPDAQAAKDKIIIWQDKATSP